MQKRCKGEQLPVLTDGNCIRNASSVGLSVITFLVAKTSSLKIESPNIFLMLRIFTLCSTIFFEEKG